MNTICRPSRDQPPSLATMLPSRRGEPAGKGTAHKGVSLVPAGDRVPTISCEWSAEMSSITMSGTGVGIAEVSPPFTDTWTSTGPSERN